jgi:hypothetical protein
MRGIKYNKKNNINNLSLCILGCFGVIKLILFFGEIIKLIKIIK